MREATRRIARPARWLAGLFCLGCLLAAAGCGRGGRKLLSVEGKVTAGGSALTGGVVSFWPESDKDGSQKGGPIGTINADGTYKMTTGGKEGVPPGRYKVTVSTMMPPGADVPAPSSTPIKKDKGTKSSTGVVAINPRYMAPTTSNLTVEVVANPPDGAYDLRLTR